MSAVDTAVNRDDVARVRNIMRDCETAHVAHAKRWSNDPYFVGLADAYRMCAEMVEQRLLGEDTRSDAERAS